MRSQTTMTFIGTVYNMDHLDEFPIDNPTRVYLVDGSKIGSLVYVGIRRQALSPFPLSTGDVAESDSGSKRGVILEPSSLERPGEVLQPRSKNQRQPKKTPQYRQKNQRRSRMVLPYRRKRPLVLSNSEAKRPVAAPKPPESLLPGLRFSSGPNNGHLKPVEINATLLRELQKLIGRVIFVISQIITNQG